MEVIYCMCCKTHVQASEAALKLKHGFYKTDHVGICYPCKSMMKNGK